MPFDVKMPDGTVVKNVPDGTTKDAFMSKYNSNMGTGKSPAPASPVTPTSSTVPIQPGAAQSTQPQQQPGFVDRVSADIEKRREIGQDIQKHAGEQTGYETALQQTGKVGASLVSDVAGEAMKSAYGALPEGVKEKVSGGLQKVMSSDVGKFGLSMLQKGADVYQKWAEQNPRAARDIESVVDIAGALPAAGAGKVAAKAAGEVSAVAPIAKGLMTPNNAKIDAIVGAMHKSATATIERAKQGGVIFDPTVGKNLMGKLDNLSDLRTAGERSTREGTLKAIDAMRTSVEGGDTSLRNLLGFRDKLTEVAQGGGQDGSAALKARKEIDTVIKDAHKAGSFSAQDPKAIGLVEDFRKQWGAYKTGESVADAIKLADESPAKSKKAFQKIVDSDYFKTLNPEVQSAAKLAAKGKTSGNILNAVGSIKTLLGASVGKHLPLLEAGGAIISGHPAVAAGIGGVLAAGAGAKQIQRGTAMDVLNAIRASNK